MKNKNEKLKEKKRIKRRKIWNNYNKVIIWYYLRLDKINTNEFDWNNKTFCAWCGGLIIRAQYQGCQKDKEFSWDIDHINSNNKDNRWSNLRPMHPDCNKKRASQQFALGFKNKIYFYFINFNLIGPNRSFNSYFTEYNINILDAHLPDYLYDTYD